MREDIMKKQADASFSLGWVFINDKKGSQFIWNLTSPLGEVKGLFG